MALTSAAQFQQIQRIKIEFHNIVQHIFNDPTILRQYVKENKLSVEQTKLILDAIDKLNSSLCVCCRMFDQSKLNMTPVDKNLEPLIDMARDLLNKKKNPQSNPWAFPTESVGHVSTKTW